MRPTISVLLPVYNNDLYLKQTIESIVKQSYIDWELIIVDDASTDNSRNIIDSFNDSRIKYHKNSHNLGIAQTRNLSMLHAKGKYIAVIDADDVMHPQRLLVQYMYLEKYQSVGVVGTSYQIIDEFGRHKKYISQPVQTPREINIKLLFGNCISHPTVMFRKVIADNYKYRKKYAEASDFDLWVRIKDEYRIVNIPEVLTYYRIHKNNRSSNHKVRLIVKEINKQIFRNQLLKYRIVYSEFDIELHTWLEGKDVLEFESLLLVEKWLDKLIQFNEDTKTFPSESFKYFIYQYWFRMCCLTADDGLKVFKIYTESSIQMPKSYRYKLKVILFILCILHKKNNFETYTERWQRYINECNIFSVLMNTLAFIPYTFVFKPLRKQL